MVIFRIVAWWKFYRRAVTKYKVHSPFVFEWITEVLEDRRYYYAFDEIAALRGKMLQNRTPVTITDFGAGPDGAYAGSTTPVVRTTTLSKLVHRSGSDARQGARLFRLVKWHQPKQILELGSSVGISTLYIAKSGSSPARITALEGCPQSASIARMNLEALGVANTAIITGPFSETLQQTVASYPVLDFVFFDGNHQEEPTLAYVEVCLSKAHDDTIFVLDDVHWSPGMEAAWEKVKAHPRITMTIDCGDFACAFFRKDFKEKQHFQIVPSRWKPWMVY